MKFDKLHYTRGDGNNTVKRLLQLQMEKQREKNNNFDVEMLFVVYTASK